MKGAAILSSFLWLLGGSNIVEAFGLQSRKATKPAFWNEVLVKAVAVPVLVASIVSSTEPAFADQGASSTSNAKITTGGASTLQSGRTIAITIE